MASSPASSDGGWGFIDAKGTVIVEPKFQRASRFSQGLAAACAGNRWGFINKTGKWAIPPQFDQAQDFCEGLALVAVKDAAGKMSYGYIDTLGRTVVKPRRGIVSASRFSEGLASLAVARAWYERLSPLS
jgi:hypothetical protein